MVDSDGRSQFLPAYIYLTKSGHTVAQAVLGISADKGHSYDCDTMQPSTVSLILTDCA